MPSLLKELAVLFAAPADRRFGRGRGREELRLLSCSAAPMGYSDWPHQGPACIVQRVVTRRGRTTNEESNAVASLMPARLSGCSCNSSGAATGGSRTAYIGCKT